jgi:hypothetical protein
MRKGFLVMLLVVCITCFCYAQEDERGVVPATVSKPVNIPEENKHKLQLFLPVQTQVQAEALGAPVFYAANLYEYIDGGAEVYHQYDFVTLIHQEYKAKETEVTVDIYDMGNPLNAYGLYASERSPNYNFLPIGAEGYVSDFALNFLQGTCYVKLSAFSPNGKADTVLQSFAQSISERIKTGKTLPELFNIFPRENRVARSEKFVRKSPLGHEFLSPAYQVSYSVQGQECQLMLSEAASPQQARERTARLRDHFQKSGKLEPVPLVGAEASRGSNSYEGEMLFLTQGIYTILLVNSSPSGEALLKELASKVK